MNNPIHRATRNPRHTIALLQLANKPEPLTPREYDVLCGLVTRKSKNEIAEDLGVSINTVKFHSKNIYAKWRVTRRLDVIAFWTSHVLAGTAEQLVIFRKNARFKYKLISMPVLNCLILESRPNQEYGRVQALSDL